MSNVKKTRVMVLYGGRSAEHEISLQSAASVMQHLDDTRFEVVPVAIDKQGHWQLNDISQLQLNSSKSLALQENTAAIVSQPGLPSSAENQSALISLLSSGADQAFDVIFPVLHGPLGEDGTIQGLFELVDVPYVGAGVLSSAIAMDKDVAKRLLMAAGLPVVPYITIKKEQWLRHTAQICQQVTEELAYPVFVKPANLGSSVGVHKVKQANELAAAIDDALQYDVKILIETAISAREIEISVLEHNTDDEITLVSIPGEIVPSHEFYSYAAKYLDKNGAQLVIPAVLTPAQVQRAQLLARQAFAVLECEGMARADLFLDKETGEFYINELNTIPGFTSISMYPKLWEASGIAYSELLSRLIELAISRHQRKRQLKRDC